MRSLSVKQLGKQSLILIRWQSKEENLYAEIRGEVLPSKVTARHSCAPNLDIATTSRPTKQFWKPRCNYETETKEKSASSSAWPVQQLTLLYIKTYTKTQQHCWPEDLNMQQIDTGRIPSPIHVVDFHSPHPQNTSSFLLINKEFCIFSFCQNQSHLIYMHGKTQKEQHHYRTKPTVKYLAASIPPNRVMFSYSTLTKAQWGEKGEHICVCACLASP